MMFVFINIKGITIFYRKWILLFLILIVIAFVMAFIDVTKKNNVFKYVPNVVQPVSFVLPVIEENEKKIKIEKKPSPKYTPEWSSLDTRILPEWYDRAKIGIFIHWGVYSVPGFHNEWFWYYWTQGHEAEKILMTKYYSPEFKYTDFGPMFKAEFFDPKYWANLFHKSGAKYVVLTSKHHDGYTLFPSTRSRSWNSNDVGPKRDLVAELSEAVRKEGLRFGVYYSLYEWFNPTYNFDKNMNFGTREYPSMKPFPELLQLVNHYKPSVIWSDGDWEPPDDYWDSPTFLAWLYNESPVKDDVVVNDRWGRSTACQHGDFYNCEDKFNPNLLQSHKWENAFTVDKLSWGYRRNMDIKDVMTFQELLEQVVSTVSCGGNALINIGPTKDGTIDTIFQERLLDLGKWLEVNGEAIYNTSPWFFQEDSITNKSDIWYTCVKEKYNAEHPTDVPLETDNVTAIYAILVNLPPLAKKVKLKNIVGHIKTGTHNAELVGKSGFLEWIIMNGTAEISLPEVPSHPVLKFTVKLSDALEARYGSDN